MALELKHFYSISSGIEVRNSYSWQKQHHLLCYEL